MTDFPKALKKSLYVLRALTGGVSELRWYGAFATGSSRRGSWRSLCKPPIEKCSADLQWSVVVVHIDQRVEPNCVFWSS